MKQINGYRCQICGCLYDNEADAAACEDSHAIPISVSSKTVLIMFGEVSHGQGNKYPNIVEVKMSDGKTIEYYRQFEK